MIQQSEKLTFLYYFYKSITGFLLCFTIGDEESEDGRLHMEAEEEREHQGVDFGKLEAGRRRRGAWGKRKHAATVEAAAYRIVRQCEHRHARL